MNLSVSSSQQSGARPNFVSRSMIRVAATLVAPLFAVGLSGCVSTGAPISGEQAISPEEARLQALETKVADLTRRLNGLESARTGGVVEDVRSLRGSMEQLQHDTQVAQQQNQAKFGALDQRVLHLETANNPPAPADGSTEPGATGATTTPATTPSAPATPPPPPANSAQEQSLYLANFNLLKAQKYDEAARGFRSQLDQFPQGALADNAWYWLGECYYIKRDLDKSAQSFQSLLSRFPASPKVPDATLKLGIVYLDQKKTNDGKAQLRKVIQDYPNSNAASLARTRLNQVK